MISKETIENLIDEKFDDAENKIIGIKIEQKHQEVREKLCLK